MKYYTLFLALFLTANTVSAEEEPQALNISQADKGSIVGSGNDFSSDLYGQLRMGRGNIFFSPESITQALAMTFAGARGQTANEMQTMLHFHMNNNYTHATLSALLHERNARSAKGGYSFNSANALWVQRDYTLDPTYLEQVKAQYDAVARNLDFQSDAEGSSKIINAWVDEKTAHKIPQLVTPDMLTWNTRLVLTNAVYFKADWKKGFEKNATLQEDFYQSPSQNTSVWMMHRKCADCKYTQNEHYQALAIPYKGDDIEMVVFLPRDKNGLESFEQALNPQTLREGLEALKAGETVNISLPRFHLESTFKLNTPLMALGMKEAFDPAKADFSGMTGKRELFISAVIHKAYVDVDEAGTEAAAATAVVMKSLSMAVEEGTVQEFRADHPFMFLLRDARTNAVYFMGRVENTAS